MPKTSIHARFPFILFSLFWIAGLSSCEIFYEAVQVSADLNKHSYNYRGSRSSPSGLALSFNLGMMGFAGVLGVSQPFGTTSDPYEDVLLASINNYIPPKAEHSYKHRTFDMNTIIENVYVLTGAELIGKNADEGGDKVNILSFEVPVYGVYYHAFDFGSLYGGLGPYFSYGLAGKIKYNNGDKVSSFDEEFGYRRFDAGLGIVAGLKLENDLSFYLGYESGFANIARDAEFKQHNRTWTFNFMYPL